jgi:hypothetical protein
MGSEEGSDFGEARRGEVVPIPPGKTRITIRLDNEILDWFRSQVDARGGGSYQAMINDALKDYVRRGGEALEPLLRRVIREELSSRDPRASLFSIPPGRL